MKTEKKEKSIMKAGLSLSLITMASRVCGLLREMIKSRFLGTSDLADAYNVAFQIPNFFRRLFAENSVSVAFIPTFNKYLQNDNQKETQEFVSATLTFLTIIVSVTVGIGMIFTPQIVPLFTKHVDDVNHLNEMTLLTRIMFPYLLVISIAALFQGILNGFKIFVPSGFTPILFNLTIVSVTLIFSKKTANPARAMAIGVLLGGCIQAIFQIPFVLKQGIRLSFTSLRKAFSNPGTKKVIKLIAPTILGMATYQLNNLVSSSLATKAGTGVFSSIHYSLQLQELILGVFAVTIGTVMLPDLSIFVKKNDWDNFKTMFERAVKIMIMITVPITFYSIIYGKNIISLLFEGAMFNEDSVNSTYSVFFFHIIGLVFIALNRIIAPAFYAQSDTFSPTVAGIIGFGINIILAFVLSPSLKGPGIALALTISSAVNLFVLFLMMNRNKNIDFKSCIFQILIYAIRILVLSVVASVPVYLTKASIVDMFSGHNKIISQGVPVVLSAGLFFVIGVFLLIVTKDPIVVLIKQTLQKKLKK